MLSRWKWQNSQERHYVMVKGGQHIKKLKGLGARRDKCGGAKSKREGAIPREKGGGGGGGGGAVLSPSLY